MAYQSSLTEVFVDDKLDDIDTNFSISVHHNRFYLTLLLTLWKPAREGVLRAPNRLHMVSTRITHTTGLAEPVEAA